MDVLTITNLKKHFGEVKAVDGISLSVKKGEVFGFLGPNGAGKSTTIRCIMDFLRPTEGTVIIDGLDAQLHSTEAKLKIGYLAPDVKLYDNKTGQEHIDLVQKLRGPAKHVQKLVKELDFNPKMKTKALSSGNKQKLGLILALMHEPELLVLDEPTVALDPLLQNKVYRILKEYGEKGGTVFISSHNLAEVERICNRAAIIRQGKLVAVEEIDALRQKRIHIVSAQIDGELDATIAGTEVISKENGSLMLRVTGDLNPLIQELAKHGINDLEISHASLEDVFLSFYERN